MPVASYNVVFPFELHILVLPFINCYIIEGGKLLAYYEESSRKFLFPDKSLTKKDGLDREILLSRTVKFQVKLQFKQRPF